MRDVHKRLLDKNAREENSREIYWKDYVIKNGSSFISVTQPLGWLSRNQSPVRRLIWLWYAASWARS